MRTALIGGASKGLGLGCAASLAAKGFRVVMCARNETILNESAKRLQREHRNDQIIPIPCDWSKKEALDDLKQTLDQRELRIDVLVNNIGGPKPGRVTETSESEWETGLDLLFRSTIRLYGHFLPSMRHQKWGRIINILSTTAIEPAPTLAVSSVIRAGLTCYAKLTALEVGRDNVTINSIMPGGFITARTEELERLVASQEGLTVEAIRRRTAASIPLGRMLETSELGNLVSFLCSEQSSGLTGMLLPVDGLMLKSI